MTDISLRQETTNRHRDIIQLGGRGGKKFGVGIQFWEKFNKNFEQKLTMSTATTITTTSTTTILQTQKLLLQLIPQEVLLIHPL